MKIMKKSVLDRETSKRKGPEADNLGLLGKEKGDQCARKGMSGRESRRGERREEWTDHEEQGQQIWSVKGQIVNIFNSAGQINSEATTRQSSEV